MKFLKWIMFNVFLYGTLTVAHILGSGEGWAGILTVLVYLFAAVYFLYAIVVSGKTGADTKSIEKLSFNWWNFFDFLWIILVFKLGYNNLVVPMVAELTIYYYLVLLIRAKEKEDNT